MPTLVGIGRIYQGPAEASVTMDFLVLHIFVTPTLVGIFETYLISYYQRYKCYSSLI